MTLLASSFENIMARVGIKSGVQPPLLRIFAAISNVAQELDHPKEVVITSGMDGQHMPNSYHYSLRALDVRTKTFSCIAAKQEFLELLKEELGGDYDVLLEGLGRLHEHIHVEFDP
jgi:hypothetical protein